MPRLARHTAFDISDEPDEGCYDATGQFPHLVTTEPDDDSEPPKRRRTIAYLALTAAAAAVGAGRQSRARCGAADRARAEPVAHEPGAGEARRRAADPRQPRTRQVTRR